MTISRRDLAERLPALGLLTIGLLQAGSASAESGEEAAVLQRLQAFRNAQFAHDAAGLGALCTEQLSYSHSDAHIEDKATFIKNATSDKSKFLSLEYKDPWARVVGDTALVRFHWMAESETIPEGKKSATNLHIFMVWQKQDGAWKLLGRASTKL